MNTDLLGFNRGAVWYAAAGGTATRNSDAPAGKPTVFVASGTARLWKTKLAIAAVEPSTLMLRPKLGRGESGSGSGSGSSRGPMTSTERGPEQGVLDSRTMFTSISP